MTQDKVKMALLLAIGFSLFGLYKVGKTAYTAIVWEKTEGFVIDFERHTMTCGRGSSRCFSIIVGFRSGDRHYRANGEKKFSEPPRELEGVPITVYYPASDPHSAILGGRHGPGNTGFIALLVGFVMFIVYWFSRDRS